MTTTAPAPTPPPNTARPTPTLEPHQQQSVDFMTSRPFSGIWLTMGGGKTLSTLTTLQWVRPMGHILVVAPVSIARSTWLDEIDNWQIPIRTRSLIVDEHDKKLTKDARLARFKQIFTDPPTMYFINQELITKTPQMTNKLVPTIQTGNPPAISNEAAQVLDLLVNQGPMPQDDLVEAVRAHVLAGSNPPSKPPAKKKVNDCIKELRKAKLIETQSFECATCGGSGCADCRFGLIDQMPIQKLAGPDGRKRDTIIWPFQTVIIDESQGFKSHSSKRFKALASVRPAITRLIELTGTPCPNGLEDLWAQAYLLDQGEALGKNITAFRNRWFTPKMIPGTTTPAKWIPNQGAEEEIHQAISHLVMSAKNTSLKLPELSIENVSVTMPGDLLEKYRDFKRELVLDVVNDVAIRTAHEDYEKWMRNSSEPEAQAIRDDLDSLSGDDLAAAYERHRDDHVQRLLTVPDAELVKTVIAANPAVLTSKLLQFASGTLYTSDPDDPSTTGDYEVIHDQKIEMTEYLIRNNGGRPVLLAYHFGSDKKELLARLPKSGIDVQAFDGSRDMIRRWNNGEIQVMLVHPASAGHGLNLQHGGSTMIWYTLPFSLEHYLQTNARLHRPGQTEPVTIYRLLTKGTQDERMPGVLQDKQLTQDRLIQAVSLDQALEDALTTELEDEIYAELDDYWSNTRL